MKKILAFVLSATLLCAMFVLPAAAEDNKNFEAEIPFVEIAPSVNGVVDVNEYGSIFAMHSYSENPEQFVTDNDAYGNWDVEFYAAYDADKLYMAWVVESDIHAGLPKTDFNSDGTFDEGDYGYMWMYSCVQFILTPGNPTSGENYAGNYLEVGLCLLEDSTDEYARVAWNLPAGVDESEISINDWDAVIVRDDDAGTTTYEVAIPKEMSGLSSFGSGAEFGLSYAAAAQEYYDSTHGMLEWQDAILGAGKVPNNCAIMTLADSDVEQTNTGLGLQDGELPADAADALQIGIDKTEGYIIGEDALLVLDTTKAYDYSTYNCTNLVFAPIEGSEGEYEVIDRKVGDGNSDNLVVYDRDIEVEGVFILSINSNGGAGADRLAAFNTIGEGSVVKFFGIDFETGERLYKNSMMYVIDLVDPVEDEPSEEPSEDPSEEPSEEPSSEESKEESEEESKEESKAPTSSTAASVDNNDDEGSPVIWIVIAVVAVVVIAAVVVIVLKKKKA